jgi:phospholipid/cholesterol/gamma-HCH transport system permease protein
VSDENDPLRPDRLDLIAEAAGQVRLTGALGVRTLHALQGTTPQALDLSGLTRLDTAGAYLLVGLHAQGVRLSGLSAGHQALMDRVAAAIPVAEQKAERQWSLARLIAGLGRSVAGAGQFWAEIMTMFGLFLVRFGMVLRNPRQMPLTALVHHADHVGLRAVPIVGLMAFLIGVVLAFQGAVQLRQFGAEIFVVDLIAISILRELGILLTAIIVAGRTASSFTAAIGSMKMREEIDAMRTLAIDPGLVLFFPRILALVITLPILGMVANVLGLFGGAMMAWIEMGIAPSLFWDRLLAETSIDHVIVGFAKGPFFALIIGVVGCHAGMKVGGNAESLGRQTSVAVVRAIFAVIVADALFSVFFAMVDL